MKYGLTIVDDETVVYWFNTDDKENTYESYSLNTDQSNNWKNGYLTQSYYRKLSPNHKLELQSYVAIYLRLNRCIPKDFPPKLKKKLGWVIGKRHNSFMIYGNGCRPKGLNEEWSVMDKLRKKVKDNGGTVSKDSAW